MARSTCPQFSELDRELINDFYGSFQEAMEEISACRSALEEHGEDKELLNRLFRAVHSLKGNCNMMFLPPFVDVTHKLEEVFDDIRKDKYPYDPAFCAFAQAAITDIDEQLRALIQTQIFDADVLAKVGKLITPLRNAESPQERTRLAGLATTAVLDRHYDLQLAGKGGKAAASPPKAWQGDEARMLDMEFLSDIASALDSCRPNWRGRVSRQLELCKMINREMGYPVAEPQLMAAVFLHDMAMTWLPENLWQKWADLNEKEKRMAVRHVEWASGLLKRWGGWEEAALFIEQHHEWYDGSGLPMALKGDGLSIGAQLIALADLFFDATLARAEDGYKQSLLGAVKDINGHSQRQFAGSIVEAFNSVIRQHYLAQPRW